MLWIVGLVICFIAYWFISDRKNDKQMIRNKGGLNQLYPNFITYISTINESVRIMNLDPNTCESGWELVKFTDRVIEYKLACHTDGFLTGYFYYSVRHDFAGRVEGYFITNEGNILNGGLIEFKRNSPEPSEEEYAQYCAALGNRIFKSAEFEQYIQSNFL